MTLSTKAKEAIKVAVSVVIGYYLALRLDWLNPTWVAISIAMISLPTAGQSLQKGALRMGGTLVAFVAGLFFLGLFPQDRWLFLLPLTPFLFVCGYCVQGRNGQYFWYVAGFVTLMIVTAGPSSSEYAFKFAAYRSLETLIGILVWTLVSVLVWPQTNLETLKKVAEELLDGHRKLLEAYRSSLHGNEVSTPVAKLRDDVAKLIGSLETTINAAAAESYQVHEVRKYWKQLHRDGLEVLEILDRLGSGLSDRQREDLKETIENEEQLYDELSARFEEARQVLQGEAPSRASVDIVIGTDPERVSRLNHFEKAVVEMTRQELERLDDLVAGMVSTAREIEGFDREPQAPVRPESALPLRGPLGFAPLDPDRIRGAIVVTLSMWVSFLLWIFVNPPGHQGWIQFVPTLVLLCVQMPSVRVSLVGPFAYAYSVGLLVYVFVMPQLSTFGQLSGVIFAFSFVAAYFFGTIGRAALFLSMFSMLGIHNQQTYDFASVANLFLFNMLGLLAMTAFTYLLRSPRPEKAFLALVSRFFESLEVLLSRFGQGTFEAQGKLEQWRRAYHLQIIRSMPSKLAAWGRSIDAKRYPGTDPKEVEALVACVQLLVYRMEDLYRARQAPQAEALVAEMTDSVRSWREAIERQCGKWAECPEAGDGDDLRQRLDQRMTALESKIEETMDRLSASELSSEESSNFYRLLAGFRGFSEAALRFAGIAGTIRWEPMREEHF